MNKLTDGERVVRCLAGEPVDRAPFGVGIGWLPWSETLQIWRDTSGMADLEPAKYLGFDSSFALPSVEYGVFPAFQETVIEETVNYKILRDSRGITMKRHNDGSMPHWIDHPVKTPDDWEQLRPRLQMDEARITEDWPQFRARLKKTGEAVQVGAFPWGVFGTVRDLMGNEQVLYAFYDFPDMMRDMMNTLTNLWINLYERVADEVQIDHIHIWEDMSGRNGSLISPDMVEEFMMPCYDRIVAFAKAHGVRIVSVDTDGDCSQLVPIFVKHGVNMMLPFEVQAGNDIADYQRNYPMLGIMYGLDKRALAGTRADVDRQLEIADAMISRGRYIPGFDHLIPPDAKWENFRYAAEKIRELCRAR